MLDTYVRREDGKARAGTVVDGAGNFRLSRRVAKDKMLFRIGRRRQLLELHKSFTQN